MTKEFDPAGRLMKSSFGEELTCTLSREEGMEGMATFATSAGSVRTHYDLYGRLGGLEFSYGGVERYTYQASRRPEVVIRNGEEIRYKYDAAGCVNAISTSKGKEKLFERDGHRRLVESTRNGAEPARTVRFRYDTEGNRSRDEQEFRFSSGNRLVGTPKEILKYDLRGRLVERRPRNGVPTEYQYSAEGFLKEVICGRRPDSLSLRCAWPPDFEDL